MKKRIALLALALTLCSAFAAFPVSAHEAEAITETETVITESVRNEEKVIHLYERDLNRWFSLRQYVGETRKTMEFTTDSPAASIERNSIRIDKSILDQELYGETPEVIVECMLGAYKDLPEKKMTLRFICERNRSARTDIDSRCDTDETEDDGFRPFYGGKRTDCGTRFDPDQMQNTSEKINKASLFAMSGKTSFTAVSGVTVSPAIISSSIIAPSGPIFNEKISSDPVLSDRYNTDSDKIMALRVPAFCSVSRTINVDLGNENVTPLLGSNTIDMIGGSTTVGSGSRLYVYNISSDNAYEVLAKSS